MEGAVPAVSIVLRARNEASALPEVLGALASQSLSGAEWILVDHASTDATATLARAAGARVVALPETSFSYGRALNLGLAACRAPIAVALSAHATPASWRWLEALISPLHDARVAAVCGPEWPRRDADAVIRRGLRRRYAGLTRHDLSPSGSLTFGCANAALRLAVWRQFAFDETLPYAEDLEWSLRVMGAGYRVLFDPAAPVVHSHRDSPQQAYRRAFAEGVAARRLGRPQRHHRAAGLWATLAAGSALDALTLAGERALPVEWARALRCRWARALGGWRGYRAGSAA
jgi:glycosyltransferase involved in cell wall biosynthesis